MSIRLRLALWYTAVLGVVLIVFSMLLYIVMERHLLGEGDESISARAQHVGSAIRVEPTELPQVQRVELPPIDAFESPGIYVQVVQTDGAIIAHSDNLGGQTLPRDDQAFAVAQSGTGAFYTAAIGEDQLRIYVRPLAVEGRIIGLVQVGRSSSQAYAVLDRLRLGLLVAGAISLLLAGFFAWGIAGGALRPIAAITQTARAIALSRGFSRRLEETGSRDELGQLGVTFNEMLTSLEEAYATQQRFVADASHELRAPLTTIRANLELLNRHAERLPVKEREGLKATTNEANRMARLVANLLSLARADAGQKLQMRPVELDRLVLEACSQVSLLAMDVKLTIRHIDQVSLLAEPDHLKQLVLILVDNAIKYTPPDGEVSVSLHKSVGIATVVVADTGAGISSEDLPHIFERFYRADKARARSSAGTGLGLAIAKWIVEQHGGDIAVDSSPGIGTTFVVRFPLVPTQKALLAQPKAVHTRG